ncbi:hypothetical protein GCM10020220_113260 [Nonomuraea rubra]
MVVMSLPYPRPGVPPLYLARVGGHVLDDGTRQHRLAAEPRDLQVRQLPVAPVDEVLHAFDDLGTHASDGEVLITVGAPEIALLCGKQNEVKPVAAERGDHFPIERGHVRKATPLI